MCEVFLQSRCKGPPGTAMAIETEFGRVIACNSHSCKVPNQITSRHVSILTGDDTL